jgi:Homeodomain-like domain
MDERLKFVARLLDGEKMAGLCREFGISRKTGYKILARYNEIGPEGLTDHSRRPYRHANQLPFQIETQIVRLKEEKPSWGAPKIRERLSLLYPDVHTPAISTVHAVLDRRGLAIYQINPSSRWAAGPYPCRCRRSQQRSPQRELRPKRRVLSSLEFPFLHATRCTLRASLHHWSPAALNGSPPPETVGHFEGDRALWDTVRRQIFLCRLLLGRPQRAATGRLGCLARPKSPAFAWKSAANLATLP